MDNREVLLEVKNVSKIYGDLHALKEVSFQVRKGEWVAIMGSSGSGKSTMMNIIGCMDKPSVGEVILDGQDITKESQNSLTKIRREKIGLIFQQFHLIPYLTALENVMVAQYYHSIPDEQEALQALERVGLKDRAKHLPSQLSGGEQQRVCIARALINSPEIILADEPTGNLDEVNEKIVIDILTQLHEEGSTIIVVTHDLEVGDVAEMLKLQSGAEKQNETAPQKSEEQQADVNRDVLAKLKPGDIGYLSLRGFYMEAVDSFISQYESDIDGKKKALIIDLRGNPGGDVEAATKLLDYFLPDHLQKPKRKASQPSQTQENSPETSNAQATGTEGSNTQYGGENASASVLEVTPNPNRQFDKDKTLLLYTEDKWGKGKDWYAKDGHEVDLPIIILMNQNSASASELFAGTMQDYDRAWVFGTVSYGKGIVQTVRSFPDGSAVEFTTHYYFTPAGRNIHKKGITPDLTVEMPEADQFTYLRDRTKDLQLRKAAESLYINFIHDKNSP